LAPTLVTFVRAHPGVGSSDTPTTRMGMTPAKRHLDRVRRFFQIAHRDNVLFLASALSFDALLTAIPFAILLLSVLGFFLDARAEGVPDLLTTLQRVLPAHEGGLEDPIARAEEIITAVVESRHELSFYGVPLFIVFSTRLFASTRIALDQIFHVRTRRRWRHDMGHDLMLVGVVTILIIANAVVTVPALSSTAIQQVYSHVLAIIFGTLLFFSVYALAPTRKPRLDTAFIAALSAALVFEFTKIAYGAYLEAFVSVNRVISHANGVALFLFIVWIYVSAVVFLLGGEFVKGRYVRQSAEFIRPAVNDNDVAR